MFVRDEVAMNYLARIILLTFPLLGVILGTWGFIWGALMLVAVFLVGLRKGLPITALSLLIGYTAALIVFGTSVVNLMSFVPLAGLLGVLGWHKRWPVRVTFFWGATLAAVLGVIPTLSFVMEGFSDIAVNDVINSTVLQYQTSGLMAMIQQQGITEVQFRELLQEGIHLYTMVIPGFAALIALVEFGFVFYFVRIWFNKGEERIPFTRWRLPWYAVWGAVIGIAFYLLGDQFSWINLRIVGVNLMVIYGVLTLVLGVSVFLFLLQSPKIPRILKLALILAGIIYLFFSVVSLIMFGLFDLLFNFRRLPEEA